VANPAVVNQNTQPNNTGCKSGAIEGFGFTQLAAGPTWRNIAREIAGAAVLQRPISTADLDEAEQQLKLEAPGAEDATALAQRIGSTVIAHNQVDELTGAVVKTITIGDDVFANETVKTGQDSNGKFVFTDDTNLAIGPRSTVKLDRFVFSGDEKTYSSAVISLTKGTFRFITGNSQKKAYEIDTPTASIGVRGTIVDIKIGAGLTTVALREGDATVCAHGNPSHCAALSPGQTVNVTSTNVARSQTAWSFASTCGGNSALCGRTTVAEAAAIPGVQRLAQGSSGAQTPCAP
jgi:ferric-dicitrate binding protein FerR (iron transport regulator)